MHVDAGLGKTSNPKFLLVQVLKFLAAHKEQRPKITSSNLTPAISMSIPAAVKFLP